MADQCPLCNSLLKKCPAYLELYFYNCPNCGKYGLEEDIVDYNLPSYNNNQKLTLSNYIYRHQTKANHNTLKIYNNDIENIFKNHSLPTPLEITDMLITYIGDKWSKHRNLITISSKDFEHDLAKYGVQDQMVLFSHIGTLKENGYLKGNLNEDIFKCDSVNLSLIGWQRYEELKRGATESMQGFMAMKYGDELLDEVFRDHFKPAIEKTGFKLVRLDDEPEPGSIDNRLRMEIKRSKFLVVDLTYGNNGAYWEAGYAEGLGKPVIYTCEESHFDKVGTHFDTNHQLTLKWNKENLQKSADELKATIRREFPDEAKMFDEE
jgi:hypothetical protein